MPGNPPALPRRAFASEGVWGEPGWGCGGAALSVPGLAAQSVSDCPSSGSSAASPPPSVSQGSTPRDVTTGWRSGGVYAS